MKTFAFVLLTAVITVLLFKATAYYEEDDAKKVAQEYNQKLATLESDFKYEAKWRQRVEQQRRFDNPASVIRVQPAVAISPPLRWWEKKKELTWVAVVMAFNHNLDKLHAFLGKQIDELKGCPMPLSEDVCMHKVSKMMVAVDAYLKKIVIEHGGPLIDRNWDTH